MNTKRGWPELCARKRKRKGPNGRSQVGGFANGALAKLELRSLENRGPSYAIFANLQYLQTPNTCNISPPNCVFSALGELSSTTETVQTGRKRCKHLSAIGNERCPTGRLPVGLRLRAEDN